MPREGVHDLSMLRSVLRHQRSGLSRGDSAACFYVLRHEQADVRRRAIELGASIDGEAARFYLSRVRLAWRAAASSQALEVRHPCPRTA